MKVQHIIGADLSKRSIDLVYHLSKTHIKINNSVDGYNDLIRWLQKLNIDISETMIVMEHTGLYSYGFENFLHRHRIVFCKINALEIKKSIGLVRGKTDRLDAGRIAEYGYEKKDKLITDKPLSSGLKRLQVLHSTYQRLVRHRAALINALKEYKYIGIAEGDLIIQTQRQLINKFDKQIKKLMSEIEMVINNLPALKQNFLLLQSIKGIGKIVSLTAIIKTHNFTRFINARKFACFVERLHLITVQELALERNPGSATWPINK